MESFVTPAPSQSSVCEVKGLDRRGRVSRMMEALRQ